MKRLIFFVLILLTTLNHKEVFSQEFTPKVAVSSFFNTEDFFIGLGAGTMFEKTNTSLLISFYARPFRRRVLVQQSSNFFIQYRERRYLFGPELIQAIEVSEGISIYVEGASQLVFGDYSGSDAGPKEQFLFSYGAGLKFYNDDSEISFGLRRIPMPDITPLFLNISYTVKF